MSAIITKIDPRSPAEKAGLQVGETLLTIGGRAIRDVLDYPGNSVYVVKGKYEYMM